MRRFLTYFLLIVLLVVCCFGCWPKSKFPPSRARSPVNQEIEMPRSGEATLIARSEWARHLAVNLPDPPRVRWFEGDPLTYKGLTLKVHSMYRAGIEIQVGVATPETRISATGFAHEMLHWALYETTGDGNAAHDLPIWKQTGSVNQALQAAGL